MRALRTGNKAECVAEVKQETLDAAGRLILQQDAIYRFSTDNSGTKLTLKWKPYDEMVRLAIDYDTIWLLNSVTLYGKLLEDLPQVIKVNILPTSSVQPGSSKMRMIWQHYENQARVAELLSLHLMRSTRKETHFTRSTSGETSK